MTLETPSRMQVVRKEEKESRLKDFIASELSRHSDGTGLQMLSCLVLARACDGPVMRALAAFSKELYDRGVLVRAMLAMSPASGGKKNTHDRQWIAEASVRWARNPRLIDAHEMLVIGTSSAWTGDCMRRDPDQRDAYECYSRDDRRAAEWATRSFERLWALSEPIAPFRMSTTSRDMCMAPQVTAADVQAGVARDAATPPTPGATKH